MEKNSSSSKPPQPQPQQAQTKLVDPRTVWSELNKFKPELDAALPRHLNPDRLARIALTELRKNPKLFQCTKESFMGSLLMAAQLGLEPGILGQCYLIPYKDICTLIPGWRGYMDLLSRTGRASAWTGAIFDGDEFDFAFGDRPFIHHRPGKRHGVFEAMMHTYAVGRVNGQEWPVIDVWDIDRIWQHRNRQNKVGDRHYSYAYPEMYARKIPLLQVMKYLPSSVELTTAGQLDTSGTEEKQRLTIDMARLGDLGSSVEEAEVEKLMEDLGWDDAKRAQFRDQYEGRASAAVAYLDGEVSKAKGPQKNAGGTKSAAPEEKKPQVEQAGVQTQANPATNAEVKPQGQTQPAPSGDFWA